MISHNIENEIYKIEINDERVLEIELDKEKEQISIKTDRELWAGPVHLLRLTDV